MADASGAGYKGPRLGDAASLWNFTTAPGWTTSETLILQHALQHFGVGRWVQILDSDVLPGKTIQQLNGQTQRLLGKQSLAAYTGLKLDIDKIRGDNQAMKDVERKNGLVINSGPNPTAEARKKWQAESNAKYKLTEEQVAENGRKMKELAALTRGTENVDADKNENKAKSPEQARIRTMTSDVATLDNATREQVIQKLVARAKDLLERVVKAQSSSDVQNDKAAGKKKLDATPDVGLAENRKRARV